MRPGNGFEFETNIIYLSNKDKVTMYNKTHSVNIYIYIYVYTLVIPFILVFVLFSETHMT